MRQIRNLILGALVMLPSMAAAQESRPQLLIPPSSTSEIRFIQQQTPAPAAPTKVIATQTPCGDPCSASCCDPCAKPCGKSCAGLFKSEWKSSCPTPCSTNCNPCTTPSAPCQAKPCQETCKSCPTPCCEPVVCEKRCVPETSTKKVQKVHYSSKCEEYCLPKCPKWSLFGSKDCCDTCTDNCGKVRTRNVLVKKIRTCEEQETKCVVPKCETTIIAPAAPVKK